MRPSCRVPGRGPRPVTWVGPAHVCFSGAASLCPRCSLSPMAGWGGQRETDRHGLGLSESRHTMKCRGDLQVLGCFSPGLQRFLPARQSAGAAGSGLQDEAQALAVSRTVLWDPIHAGDRRFLAQLVSGGRGGRNKTICQV